jgi:N6-adenosine-specific RNA methylase IME4
MTETTERFVTVVADPPWPFGDRLPGPSRGAEKNYRIMSVQDLRALGAGGLPPVAPDARLFLWRVSSMQQEALDVMRAWGFEQKAEIVWRKLTKTGKRHFGMGRTVRMEHEVCLVGVRGRPPILSKSVRSMFDTEIWIDDDPATGEPIGEFAAPYEFHSKKPDVFYEIVEQLSPAPYVELFARQARAGWTSIGDALGTRLEPVARRAAMGD